MLGEPQEHDPTSLELKYPAQVKRVVAPFAVEPKSALEPKSAPARGTACRRL